MFTVIPLHFNAEEAKAKTYKSQQDAVIDIALSKEGQTAGHFGWTTEWCTRFVNWTMEAAGLNDDKVYPKSGLGNCTHFAKYFHEKGTYVSLYKSGPGYFGKTTKVNKNHIPKKGDIVFFKNGGYINHVALVVSVKLKNKLPDKITVVHGNWMDRVAVTEEKSHGVTYASEIIGYATPLYKKTSKWTTKDIVQEKFTKYNATGKVNVGKEYLNVRSGPGTTYSSIGSLTDGKKVTITEKSKSWYKIKYNSGIGYVSAEYIKIDGTTTTTPATPTPTAPTNTTKATNKPGKVNLDSGSSYLNVRKNSGTKYKIIGTLKKNAKVTITGTKGSWYKIKFKSGTGYVKKSYIKLIKKGTVNVSGGSILNVRKNAGTKYNVVGTLKNKESVTITGVKGTWYEIKFGSGSGYVKKSYIKVK